MRSYLFGLPNVSTLVSALSTLAWSIPDPNNAWSTQRLSASSQSLSLCAGIAYTIVEFGPWQSEVVHDRVKLQRWPLYIWLSPPDRDLLSCILLSVVNALLPKWLNNMCSCCICRLIFISNVWWLWILIGCAPMIFVLICLRLSHHVFVWCLGLVWLQTVSFVSRWMCSNALIIIVPSPCRWQDYW